jgi:hypothetical protein
VAWYTNAGNEKGEVLVFILTTSESLSNLDKMAQGLMDQFQIAGQQPAPKVLYTDLDCGFSKFKMMFNKLGRNGYRLDSWYLCADLQPLPPESHPLYGNFM